MESALLRSWEAYGNLGTTCQEALLAFCRMRSYPKHSFLLHEGEVCQHLYFVESGVLRGASYRDEQEVTVWFGLAEQLATSFSSFITKQPSRESIQVMTDATVVVIHHRELEAWYDQFPAAQRLGRKLTERYFIWLEQRSLSMQFESARQKYEHLLRTEPGVVSQVPLTYVASYLGITRETLSRVRHALATEHF